VVTEALGLFGEAELSGNHERTSMLILPHSMDRPEYQQRSADSIGAV